MKLDKAKSGLKVAVIITCVVSLFASFIIGIIVSDERDHAANERAICAPNKLQHSFLIHNKSHGVCIKEDGTLYLSDRTR